VAHVRSAASFLAEYSSIVLTKLSLHSGTHPPGAVLFLYGVSQLIAPDILTAALASIVFTSLSVVPAYLLALELTGKKTAGFALFLYLLAPNAAMFNATCMDGVFSVFPIAALYLFCRALLPYWRDAPHSPRQLVLYSALTGLALGAGMLLSFATVFIVALFSAAVLLTRLADNPPKKLLAAALASAATICALLFLLVFHQKNVYALAGTVLFGLGACWVLLAGTWSLRFKAGLAALCIAGFVFIVFYFALYLATDYNLLSSLKVALRKDSHNMGSGLESVGRYLYLSCANFAAFFIAVGLPITVLWLRETCVIATSWCRVVMQPDSACMDAATGKSPLAHLQLAGLYAMAFIATLLTLNFASLFTLEVERIWIFMIPIIAVAAGRQLQELCERAGSLRPALGVGIPLAGQTLLFETYLYTYW
jgi:asparagine N-glycosylation enzyme membrane subunit Stt3